MNHSYWLIVIFVATIVCNTSARPQDVDLKNVYPVYRPGKELDLTKPNRYDKFNVIRLSNNNKNRQKRETESVSYVRIDIPHPKKVNNNRTKVRSFGGGNVHDLDVVNKDSHLVSQFLENSVHDLKVPQNSTGSRNGTKEVSYVPVFLSNKNKNNTSIKKWPGDQNGVESLDDLMLYNMYTNGLSSHQKPYQSSTGYIKKPIMSNHQNYPYLTQNKPSIIIIEELTTKRPFYDYTKPDTVYSQPIYTQNRPYVETNTYRPITTTSSYDYLPQPPLPPPTYYEPKPTYPLPTYEINNKPSYVTHKPLFVQNEEYTQGYPVYPEVPSTTTKKPKKTKKPNCPNVIVTASSSVVNSNNINHNKEACNDININIETNLNNSNDVTQSSDLVEDIYNDPVPTTPRPIFPRPTIFNIFRPPQQNPFLQFFQAIGSVFSNFSSFVTFPILSTMFSPLTVMIAGGIGISALFFPWAFPFFFFGRNRGRNRFIILRNRSDKPQKYFYGSPNENSHYLKRAKRGIGSEIKEILPEYCSYLCFDEENRKRVQRDLINCSECFFTNTKRQNRPQEVEEWVDELKTHSQIHNWWWIKDNT